MTIRRNHVDTIDYQKLKSSCILNLESYYKNAFINLLCVYTHVLCIAS